MWASLRIKDARLTRLHLIESEAVLNVAAEIGSRDTNTGK
jgi:hypothetical protein